MKRCHRCGRDLPPGAYRKRRSVRCRECEAGPPAQPSPAVVSTAPPTDAGVTIGDAAAVRLVRVGLEEARRRGLDFGGAWDTVVSVALLDIPTEERTAWLWTLRETRSTWEAAYGQVVPQQGQH